MIDLFVCVDDNESEVFLRPSRVARAMGDVLGRPVRSVTVLERATGMSSTYRDSEDDDRHWHPSGGR